MTNQSSYSVTAPSKTEASLTAQRDNLEKQLNKARKDAQIELLEELLTSYRGLSVGKYPAQRIIEDKLNSLKGE